MNGLSAYSVAQSFDPAPRQTFQVDRHYLLYAAAGVMRLEAAGLIWSLPPARAALIAANEPIGVTLPVRVDCRSVLFAPDFVPPPKYVLCVFEMTPLARELVLECSRWGPEEEEISDYASGLFGTLAAVAWKLAETPSLLTMPAPKSDVLRKVLERAERSLCDPPAFEDLATEVAMSPRSLTRRISGELGMSWRQVLQKLRVIAAVEALSTSDLPVTDIAFAQGYQSLSAFNSAFRELTGSTPSAYRASFGKSKAE